jgi:hypothetical protein
LELGKAFKGFRFQPQLYADFMKVARLGGYTVTGAFEKFMGGCVEVDALVFPDRRILDFEAESRVLADWLGKGKHFYRTETGEEVNIQGRLLWLLPKINDCALKKDVEEVLKKSVLKQE